VSAGRFIVAIGGDTTVGREAILAGVRAEFSSATGNTVTQTGSSGSLVEGAFAAFVAAGKTGTRGDLWDDALYIDGANNALGFRSVGATYPCGIATSAVTPTGATTHAIRINVAGTDAYIPVYAAAAFGN